MLDRTRSATEGQAQSRSYDVIFLDLEMPVMDGLTAIKQIRKGEVLQPLSKRQYVVALTGNARQAQIDGALAAGMDDGKTACIACRRNASNVDFPLGDRKQQSSSSRIDYTT